MYANMNFLIDFSLGYKMAIASTLTQPSDWP